MPILNVEIEMRETWPSELTAAVGENRTLIRSYFRERQRIDRLGLNNVNPPTNGYRGAYDALVDQIDESLTRHRLVAYHCTRLTPNEINQVRTNGLRVLSPDLVQDRLEQCVADGLMTTDERDALAHSPMLKASLANEHGYRTGMVWLCPNRATIRDSAGVFRLFSLWGGEAVYGGHEDNAQITATLARIGEPAIVKCAIPFPCDEPYHPKYAERFLSQSVSDEIEHPEPPPKFDLRTNSGVLPSQVLEVIRFSDPRFEAFTGYSTWPAHHRGSASS